MKNNIISLLLCLVIIFTLVLTGCAKKQTPADNQEQTTTARPEATEEQNKDTEETPGEKIDRALTGAASVPANIENNQNTGKMPPSETKLSPVPEITAEEILSIKGKTKAANRIFLNGEEAEVDSRGNFGQEVTLKTGANTIEVVTLNPKGTPDKQSITVTYQPPAPKLLALAPDTSDAEVVTITGQTEPDCFLYVNNSSTKPDKKGNFSLPVKLNPGANTIEIVSTNPRGGQTLVTKNVTFNPPEPRLVFILPDKTSTTDLTVGGITDSNAVLLVYVNDVKTNINNSNGTFTGTLQLQEGLNTITAQVANKWGKTKTQQKSVLYEPITEEEEYY
jgi:hypothetical protein